MAGFFNNTKSIDYGTFQKEQEKNYTSPYQSNIDEVKKQEELRLENRKRYGIEATDEEYAQFNTIIANAENPEEESHKIGSSIKIAQETGLSPLECYLNIDNYIEALYGDKYKTSYRGAYDAICDSFQMGKNNIRIGELGNLILDAYKRGDTESIEVFKKEYNTLKNFNEKLVDNAPRFWGTEAIKCFAQSAPFTGAAGAAALFGNILMPGIGGFAATTLTTAQLTKGEELLSMLDDGIDFDIADRVSSTSALLQGLTEAALDSVTAGIGNVVSSGVKKTITKSGKQQAIEKITNTLQKKFHFGIGKKLAIQIAMDAASNIPNEMAEEGLQSLTSDISYNIAAKEQNDRIENQLNQLLDVIGNDLYNELKEENLIEEKELFEIIDNAKQSMKGAFLSTLIMGLPAVGLNTTSSYIDYKNVQKNAQNIPSFEVFKDVVKDSPVFEQIKDEQKKDTVIREVWENEQNFRDKKDAEIIANTKETTAFNENMEEAPAENEDGESAIIPAARDEKGRLYTEDTLNEKADGEPQTGTFTIGNPEASDKNLYGFINYTVDEENNTITINDFKMTAYRRGLTQEAFDEFAQEHAGTNIEWNPTTKAGKELKALLINNNASGRNNGLNYYTQENLIEAETRRSVSKQLIKYMPNLNADERAAAVALLESGARRMGKSLSTYISETFNGEIFGELKSLENQITPIQRQSMKGASNFRQYGNQVKAVIYASEHADFSTFAHEVAHIWQAQLTGDLLAQAEKAFNVKDGDWQNSMFTFADGHQESSAEAFARGFEDYLRTGKAPNAQAKTLFQKFAEFLQDVYRHLKNFITMSPEIESVYNQLMDADDSVLALAQKAVEQGDKEYIAEYHAQQKAKQELAEQQKEAEEKAKQDQKDEESEITLNDEKIAEPDLSITEEETEQKTQEEATKETTDKPYENEEDLNKNLEELTSFFDEMATDTEAQAVEQYQDIATQALCEMTLTPLEAEQAVKTVTNKEENYQKKTETAAKAASKTYDDEILIFQLAGLEGVRNIVSTEERVRRTENYYRALEMSERTNTGYDAETLARKIKQMTGWEKNASGKWVYETDDSVGFINPSVAKIINDKRAGALSDKKIKPIPLSMLYKNDELYEMYPIAKDFIVQFYTENNAVNAAITSNGIIVNTVGLSDPDTLKRRLVHEIQHIIQAVENYAEGNTDVSSTGIHGKSFAELYESLREVQTTKGVMYDASNLDLNMSNYMNNAAEIDARNVARRALMSEKERRATLLGDTADVSTPILFQLIGEKGAANLDKAEEATTRMDNLSIAKDMEKAGKDAKSIRFATGWEKGKDGLWRYEIADDYHLKNIKATNEKLDRYEKQLKKAREELKNLTDLTEEQKEKKRRMIADFVKHNALPEGTTLESMIEEAELEVHKAEMLMEYDTSLDVEKALKRLIERGVDPKDFWNDMGESFYLSGLIDNNELFKAYPQLEKVTIDFARYDVDGHQGSYDANENSIRIFPAGMRSYGQFISTLAHEVQHAIQRLEGFAVGGSAAQFKEMEAPSKLQEKIMLLDDIPMNELMNYKQHDEFKFIKENLPEVLEDNIDGLGTLEQIMDRWLEDVKNGIHTIQNVYDEIQNARKAYNKYNRLNEYANEKSAFEKYESLAGEVEARNVQSRIHMTPEERLNTLLTETADVAPEEQIVLFDGAVSESILFQTVDLTQDFAGVDSGTITEQMIENHLNSLIGQVYGTVTEPLQIQLTKENNPHVKKSNVKLEKSKKKRHFAALNKIENIINNASMTGSSDVDLTHNTKAKTLKHKSKVLKYVYFESPIKINNDYYTVYLDTERVKNQDPALLDLYNIRVKKNILTGTNLIASPQGQVNNSGILPNLSTINFQMAYHGSGASFDRFNTEQYGLSGEGSMSFGYGAYVTDSEEIARDYAKRQADNHAQKIRESITDIKSKLAGELSERAKYSYEKELQELEEKLAIAENKMPAIKIALEVLKANNFNAEEAKKDFANDTDPTYKLVYEYLNNYSYEELEAMTGRNLYTVEIPDNGYIQWDKTIAKNIRQRIVDGLYNKLIQEDYKGAERELKQELKPIVETPLNGKEIYDNLWTYLGSDKEASQFLHSIGFAGIKYPAGTNYGNGNGAYNYVIFNDDEARIVDHLQFQTHTELLKDAANFDNWQEFMEYYEREGGKPEVNLVPPESDEAWYKATWELAKGITHQESEDLTKEEQLTERSQDAMFMVHMEQPGVLENFLQEVNYINTLDFDTMGAAMDEEEQQERNRQAQLKDYIAHKLRHGSWISNATRVAQGKELTPSTRKRLLNLISLAAREYRDVYTHITGDNTYAVPESQSYFETNIAKNAKKLNKLLTPEEALAMSPEQLRALADSLSDEASNKEIAYRIKKGNLKMDDELKNYIVRLDRRLKDAEKKYEELKAETQEDYNRINDYAQRELLRTYEELLQARAKLNNKKNALDKKISAGLKITDKYQRDVYKAQATYDDIFKTWNNLTRVNRISAEVQEAMKRKEMYIAAVEEQAKLKNDKAILTQISDMRRKLVKNAMRRVPLDRVEYNHAKQIIAIQRIFYPNLKYGIESWIGETPVYLKGLVSEYLTNAEIKADIDKMLERKRLRATNRQRPRIERLQTLLRELKTSDDVNQWDEKEKQSLIRYFPKNEWIKELNLEKLEEERIDSMQLDIEEEGDIITKTVTDEKGKTNILVRHKTKFSDEIGQMVKESLGAELYNQLVNKSFEDWTTSEMERFTKRINEIYTEGRDELEAKRQAQKDEANAIRERIREAVRNTGIEFNDTDTPEERDAKLAKLDRVLGNDSTVKGSFASKKEKAQGKIGRFLHGYNDANVRRFARIIDGYDEGVNTQELFFKENECYVNKMEMLRKRNAKIDAVLKENDIDLKELYQTINVEGNSYSVDDLLYILAADQDYELIETKNGDLINDDYAPTARNAVMFGNLGSSNDLLEEKERYKQQDEETKERFANNDFTEEEKKTMEEGFSVTSTPGTQSYIAKCHIKYENVLNAAKEFIAKNPKFERLLEAIDGDYTEQFERLRQVSVEEFNSDVFRVKKYVPLYRMESNGDTNENRVREDLLATSGASTGRNFVNKGMTQKRQSISPLNQKPVEMGLYKTWADATERTEHFINYAGYVRELNRVYKGRDAQYVRRFIENRYGSGALKYIDDYIAEIANPNANSATGALDQIVRALRGKTAPAYLAWKASGIIKQAATSPWPYMQFVNPLEYLKANFDILTSKCKLYDDIKEKSVYMANRVMDPVMDLIKEQLENATNPVESGLNKFNAIGMKGLEWIDWACVAPGWLACYRKKYNELESANDIEVITAQVKAENDALDPSDPNRLGAEGIKAEAEARAMSEEEIEKAAVLFADDCTRLCQPSDRKVDLAPLFKSSGPGSEIGKAFLQFQTSLNVIWQNLRYDLPYAVRQKQFKQVVGMILGYVFAGLLVGSITEGYGGDDEEEKKKAWRKFVYYGTTQFTDAIPVIGGIVSGIDSKWIAGNKGFTSNSTDLIPMFTKATKGTENMFKGNWDKALKNYGEAAGLATGLPVSGAKELLRVAGIGDGQEGLDFKPQAFVGRRD